MSLRNRLIIAFLVLSVVPLGAVTLLSYRSSVQAFARAAEREASDRAADITRRMDIVTADLGQRMDRMFEATTASAPTPDAAPTGSGFDAEKLGQRLAPMLGQTAALLEKVEFHPVPMTGEGDADAPAPDATAPAPPAPIEPPAAPQPPAAPKPKTVVIDIPRIMAEVERETGKQVAGLDPWIASLVQQSVKIGMAGAEDSITAVAEALRKEGLPVVPADRIARRIHLKSQGRHLEMPVHKNGKLMGHVNATLNLERTLNSVMTFTQRDQGELPFAIDGNGKLYTPNAADLDRLQALGVEGLAERAADGPPQRSGEWIVVAKRDTSGILFGIARPIGEPLREIRRTSVRNLGLGLGVIALAIIGIVPISHRMTQHVSALTAGVQQLAGGDFKARVPVRSGDEFGTLAAAFNQMAADLERHQEVLVEQERLHRELELSRQIQTEMLPRSPLQSQVAEIAGVSVPAREVGGDFFNYFDLPGGRLALLVGDVSGKGVSAALLMANAQATLRARLPLESDLAALADSFDRDLDRNTPRSVYLTLFMAVLEADGRTLRYVNAGHNPQFLIRARGGIEPLNSTGLPIALYAGHGYAEAAVSVEPGDLLFLYTDGLVEAEDGAGEMFGAERLQQLLADARSSSIDDLLRLVGSAVRSFRGDVEPLDDATMMALRITAPRSDRSPV